MFGGMKEHLEDQKAIEIEKLKAERDEAIKYLTEAKELLSSFGDWSKQFEVDDFIESVKERE